MEKEENQRHRLNVDLVSKTVSLNDRSATLDQSLSNAFTEDTKDGEISLYLEYEERFGEDEAYEFLENQRDVIEALHKPRTKRKVMVSSYTEPSEKNTRHYKPQLILTGNIDTYIKR
jgi:hypothetical protein